MARPAQSPSWTEGDGTDPPGHLLGYARVSTTAQDPVLQLDELARIGQDNGKTGPLHSEVFVHGDVAKRLACGPGMSGWRSRQSELMAPAASPRTISFCGIALRTNSLWTYASGFGPTPLA